MDASPVILEGLSLPLLLDHILESHSDPTTMIICSTRQTFLTRLLHDLQPEDESSPDGPEEQQNPVESSTHRGLDPESNPSGNQRPLHPLLVPTLSLLSESHTIRVAFCPDLMHLLAYLTLLSCRDSQKTQSPAASTPPRKEESHRQPMLVILDPINLHRPTSAFSAQGFSKTFAAAVGTAHYLGLKLVMAECAEQMSVEGEARRENEVGEQGERGDETQHQPVGPWDEEVSMLNVTTKSFGVGDKAWAGRTVSIRRIAARWCRFERLAKRDDG